MEIKIRTHEEFRADRVTIEITGTNAEVRRYTDGEVANLQASEAELVAQPLRDRIAELEEARELAESGYPSELDWAAVRAERDTLREKLARRENEINQLKGQIAGYDHDRRTERDRADRITREHEACAGKLDLREKDADTFRRQRNELETQVKELEAKVKGLDRTLAESRDLVAFRDKQARASERRIFQLETRAKELEEGRAADHREIVALRGKLSEAENEVSELARRIDNARVILSDPQVTGALNRAVRDQHESGLMAQAIEKALDTLA